MMRSQPAPSIRLSQESLRGNRADEDWRGQLYYLIYDVSEPDRRTIAAPVGIAKTHSPTNAVSPRAGKSGVRFGGADRNRTDDLLLAKQALSRLSYGPRRALRKAKHGGPG